ncbi:inorganic triphosphatase [Denitratisoma sp. agr-D3]
MAEEVELKLSLAGADQRRLLRHPLLKRGRLLQRRKIVNLYFDTPDLHLFRRGVALRLRRLGSQWLQTVKAEGVSGGGLSTRPEWETAYIGRFDFSVVDDPALRRFLQGPDCQPRLLPCFETTFWRSTWRFEPRPGQGLLLMLDRGQVLAGGRQEEISELELELDGATVDDAFDLAEGLGQRICLLPELRSKAERGYRLALGQAESPHKAGISPLSLQGTARSAFRTLWLDCLEHCLRNQPGVLQSEDEEFIHQMRVALRRLRAVLALFAPVLPASAQTFLPALRPLLAALGEARDLDVVALEMVAPVQAERPRDRALTALVRDLQVRRQAARHRVAALIRSPAHGRLLLAALRLAHGWHANGPTQDGEVALVPFAAHRLARAHRRVTRRATEAEPEDWASLHRLRIAIKRLRYSLEFLAPLLRHKARERLLAGLARHQETLGLLNDWATLDARLGKDFDGTATTRAAAKRVRHWHGERRRALAASMAGDLAFLARLPAIPWKRRLVGKR